MIDFSEMLPVGMVSHGGEVAQILAELAQQARGLTGWEAFHYERISDACFELTGGIVSQNGGAKRWLEPHECISVPMSMLVAEMRARGLLAKHSDLPDVKSANASDSKDEDKSEAHLHLQFSLPKNAADRQRLFQMFHLEAEFFGAKIIACKLT